MTTIIASSLLRRNRVTQILAHNVNLQAARKHFALFRSSKVKFLHIIRPINIIPQSTRLMSILLHTFR